MRPRYSKRSHDRLIKTMEQCGTITATAKAVGMDRTTLYDWMNRHPGLREDLTEAGERWRDRLADRATGLADQLLDHYAENVEDVPPVIANNALGRALRDWGVKRVDHSGEVNLGTWLGDVAKEIEGGKDG